MRRVLRAALESLLAARVPAALGERYRRVPRLPRGAGYLVIPGEIVYADTSRPAPGRFVCFIPDQKRNAFTIELGWSADGQFPGATARPSTGPAAAVSARAERGFVRLSELYTGSGEDWDMVPLDPFDPTSLDRMMDLELRDLAREEGMSLLQPLVDDALRKLREHAPTFFAAIEGG